MTNNTSANNCGLADRDNQFNNFGSQEYYYEVLTLFKDALSVFAPIISVLDVYFDDDIDDIIIRINNSMYRMDGLRYIEGLAQEYYNDIAYYDDEVTVCRPFYGIILSPDPDDEEMVRWERDGDSWTTLLDEDDIYDELLRIEVTDVVERFATDYHNQIMIKEME